MACQRRAVWGLLYVDDAGIVSKSAEGLAKMMIVIVTVFEAAGQRYKETAQLLYLGGIIHKKAYLSLEIDQRIHIMRAWLKRFGPE